MWGVSSIQVMARSCSREESREWREDWREGEGREAAKNWEMTRRLEWATAAWRGGRSGRLGVTRGRLGRGGRVGDRGRREMTACNKGKGRRTYLSEKYAGILPALCLQCPCSKADLSSGHLYYCTIT